MLTLIPVSVASDSAANRSEWRDYNRRTSALPPHDFALRARHHARTRVHALDLGAGGLRDTPCFLDGGFARVTAMDPCPAAQESFKRHQATYGHRIQLSRARFEHFNAPPDSCDMMYSFGSLTFLKRAESPDFFRMITVALRRGGILAFTIGGSEHDWSAQAPDRLYLSKGQLHALMSGFAVEHYDEERSVHPDGTWIHCHEVIARKR